jgi:hypothetical protein
MSDTIKGNPLGIVMLKNEETGDEIAYIALDQISEEEVERLRAEHLEANTVDSTADDLGPPAPGIKPETAEEQSRALMEEALASPIVDPDSDDAPAAPADALG